MNKKTNTLITLDRMIKDYEDEMDYNLSTKNNYKKILLNEKDCNNLFGIKNQNGSQNLTRYSLPDFYYDLAKHISVIEAKLISKGELNLEHYLYQQVQKKAVVPQLQDQLNVYSTLIYAQNNGATHWNKSHLIKKEKKDEIIFNECVERGITSFNILSKIFSPEDFLNSVSYGENDKDNKFSLNLQEHLLLNIIYKEIKEAQPLVDVFHALKNLGSKIDYNKIFNLSVFRPKYMTIESLLALEDKTLENHCLSNDYIDSFNKPYILKNYVESNCAKDSLKSIFRSKDLDLITSHKEKLINNGIWKEVSHLFIKDMEVLLKKNLKNIFNKLPANLHYYALTTIDNDKVNNLVLPEIYQQANCQPYTLLEFSRDCFLTQCLFDIFTKEIGKGLEGETYTTIKEFKEYLVQHNLLENIDKMIQDNRQDNNSNNKIQWSMISIEMKISHIINNNNKNKNKI